MADDGENFDAAFLAEPGGRPPWVETTEQKAEPPVVRRRRGRGMSEAEIETKFPSLRSLQQPSGQNSKHAWTAVFNARPDVVHRVLADYIKQVHAQPGRIGQRPMPKESEVDFQSLMYGEDNDLPLHEVLPKVMKTSGREFARRAKMSRTQVQRLLRGEYSPDVNELRLIAAAVKKPPTFFVEYRKAMVVAAVINLLDERPVIASKLYKTYLEVRLNA